MAEHDRIDAAGLGVEDLDAFAEARAVFGDEDALSRLAQFRADLAAHLDLIGRDAADAKSLREVAHKTAGRAGLLGFPGLAEASGLLDEAISAGTGVPDALHQWTERAQRAVGGEPMAKL